MAETPETTADITAKMRNYSNDCNDGYHTDYGVVLEDMRNFADRFDAALKRERGDVAKLREALGKLRAELWNNTVIAGKRKFELYEIADAALAAPPRNCDAGTATEQIKRYEAYCKAHTKPGGCTGCPIVQYRRCQIAWTQLPYVAKEGGAK